MKKYIQILFIAFTVLVGVTQVQAQQVKLVSGRVISKTTKKPFSPNDGAVTILAFNTVAQAEDALKAIKENQVVLPDNDAIAGDDGYYTIRVADNGALIFRMDMGDPTFEKVDRRLEINVMIDAGIVMDEVTVTGISTDISPKPKAPSIIGNKLMLYNTFPIPAQFGRPNGRLIIQPFVIDCETQDTISYLRPLVFDGEEFNTTQIRRMGFDKRRDPLFKFVSFKPLTPEKMSIDWSDTIKIPDPLKNYRGMVRVVMEDYSHLYYDKEMMVNTCETKRPLKFLEFSFGQRELDPLKYKEQPRREKRKTKGTIKLTFLVGQAILDPNDSTNVIQLKKLRNDLLEIVNGEGTTLKEFHITGISSPEGNYAKNVELSHKRVAFAQNKINEMVSRSVMSRVYQNPNAIVAPWSEVTKMLEDEGLNDEAAQVKACVDAAPNSPDDQFAKIRELPIYQTVIVPRLPQLRAVKYVYKHEIYRELEPAEILYKYLNDDDYHSGRKPMALYEYWHLFQMIKDPAELEKLYERAYRESEQENGKPWILAANNLAVSYLRRDTFDTRILNPFIDKKVKGVNIVRKGFNGREYIVNPEEIVANQLAMYIKANDYDQASILAQMLPDTPDNEVIKAFALCLGGYYRGGSTPAEKALAKRIFNLVQNSSDINYVVMNLAMETKMNDAMAERKLKNMPTDNAICNYLRAIVYNRKGDMGLEDAKNALINCFRIDKKYINVASKDGDIGKDLYEYTMDEWDFVK